MLFRSTQSPGTTITATLHVLISASIGESIQECAKVELIYDNGTVIPPATVLKDYGVAQSLDYDVSAFYNQQPNDGQSYYNVRLTEKPDTPFGCKGGIWATDISMTVTEHFDYACGSTTDPGISPDQGTTAGGTWVDIFGSASDFGSDISNVKFGWDNLCPSGNAATVDTPDDIQFMNSSWIKVRTPASIHEDVPISIEVTPTDAPALCKTGAYIYKTLAFTANQVSQDVSIVDTVANGPFSVKSSAEYPEPFAPRDLALTRGDYPGRQFVQLSTDGVLELWDGANFERVWRKSMVQGILRSTWDVSTIGNCKNRSSIAGTIIHTLMICPASIERVYSLTKARDHVHHR